MVGKRENYNECCETCPSKSKKKSVIFGKFKREVLYWDCRKRQIIYIVFCRICRSQGYETVYIGESKNQIKTRFTWARKAVNKFDHSKPKEHTNLERHFALDHNITDPILFQKKIEIAIISQPILNNRTRGNIETIWKNQLISATNKMEKVRVLNK